jgi:hypothetical protein
VKAPPMGALAYERLMAWNPALARANQARLRELVASHQSPMAVFCTHDPVEYVAMSIWSERGGGAARSSGERAARFGRRLDPRRAGGKLAAAEGRMAADAQDLGPRQFKQRDEGALALRRVGHRS